MYSHFLFFYLCVYEHIFMYICVHIYELCIERESRWWGNGMVPLVPSLKTVLNLKNTVHQFLCQTLEHMRPKGYFSCSNSDHRLSREKEEDWFIIPPKVDSVMSTLELYLAVRELVIPYSYSPPRTDVFLLRSGWWKVTVKSLIKNIYPLGESTEVEANNVGRGWFRLAVEVDRKQTGGFDSCGKKKNSVKTKNSAVHTFWCHSQLWDQGARAALEEKDLWVTFGMTWTLGALGYYKNRSLMLFIAEPLLPGGVLDFGEYKKYFWVI